MTLQQKLSLKLLSLLSFIRPRRTAHKVIQIISTPLRISRPPSEDSQYDLAEKFQFEGLQVYHWGESHHPRILLLHGWNGRGTQMGSIAATLKDKYSVFAIDAPGHGESAGHKLNLRLYVEAIKKFSQKHGPFQAMIAHSFGTGAATVSCFEGVPCAQLVLIAGPNSYFKVVENSIAHFALSDQCSRVVVKMFQETLGYTIGELYVGKIGNQLRSTKALVIHDENDREVPLERALQIKAQWPRVELFVTRRLGHRRVLRDPAVLQKITSFIDQKAD